MPLFDIPKRNTKAEDKIVAGKSKTNVRAAPTKKSSGLLGQINAIQEEVNSKLGKYKAEYITIQSEEVLSDYIQACIENGIVAIDTETTGLDPMQDSIVGVCLYTPTRKPAYIPINHTSYITNDRLENQLEEKVVASYLKGLVIANTKVIMFNAKFDIRVLRNQLGVYLNCYWDCYLASRVLNENELHKGLKALHQKYVLEDKEDEFSFDALFKGMTFDKVPIQSAYLYAAHDAIITYELYEFQKQYLREDNEREDMVALYHVFMDIEMPCITVVCDMEDNGIKLDLEYANTLSERYHKLLEEKMDNFYKVCDEFGEELDNYRKNQGINNKLEYPINISSSSQIAITLYDVLKIDPPDKKNPRGTGEGILRKINHPIAKAIVEYRECKKLLTTYIDKLPEVVNPKDGKIHCNFNQYGADTGRFSSSDPNLQNIPSHNKEIRKMFVADEGYVLMSSDYSQQEPKVMTQMCGDPKMIKAYQEGKDLYAQLASLAFNYPYEECLEFNPDGSLNKEGKERRSQAKSILLGLLYGRGINSVAEQLNTDRSNAQKIQDKIFKGFPAIPKFEKDSLYMAQTLGYVTTLWGRKRRLPDLQLDEYEFKWVDGPKSIDPLDFNEVASSDVPKELILKYLRKLKNVWGGEKRKIFQEAREEGILIIDNGGKIADATRQTVNARIQGSAADMSKLAMIKVGNDLKLKELGFKLLIPVHDELIAECPMKNAKECAERFALLMDKAAEEKLTIPISCDVEITKQWYGERVEV